MIETALNSNSAPFIYIYIYIYIEQFVGLRKHEPVHICMDRFKLFMIVLDEDSIWLSDVLRGQT